MGIMDEEPTWKYLRVPYTHEDVDIDEPDIDKLGREGWELVAVHLIKGVEIAWFKKQEIYTQHLNTMEALEKIRKQLQKESYSLHQSIHPVREGIEAILKFLRYGET